MNSFFSEQTIKTASFSNVQQFDWQGFKGRLLSMSFIPGAEDTKYGAMLDQLNNIFIHYEKNGMIEFLYNTNLYYSHI